MPRLPQPGSDDGTWGDILNDFLGVAHNSDGSLADDAVGLANIQDGSITSIKIADGTVTNIKLASTDLTDIAGLSPSNDDVIQRKSGAWTNRTMTQVKTDLAITASDVGLGNVTNDAQLKIASNLSDVNDAATAFGNIKQAATDSATGVVELATAGETTTGTDTTRAVTPDALAGSNYGKEKVQLQVTDPNGSDLATGDGQAYFTVPPELNGFNLVDADASVTTVSSSGTPTIQIHNVTQTADMLSTAITIDVSQNTSYNAGTPPVIDTSNDDVATGDILRVDVDVAGTGTKGLTVLLSFQLP